ncbi:hypothetical protein GF337_18590 [candidate division KSB1 bacterium]|nr:hypothetical protein [candidate division KSB1 bacterium]
MSENLIGNEIEAYCGKCKSDTLHLVTAVDGIRIEKVLCKICLSYHKYRAPGSGSARAKQKKTSTVRKKRSKSAKKAAEIMNLDPTNAIDYQMSLNYDIDAKINHKIFGLGIVKNIIDSQKIEVIFSDRDRILVQNYKS